MCTLFSHHSYIVFFLLFLSLPFFFFFFFNDTATTEIYTLSLHDALPIYIITLRRRCQLRGIELRVVSQGVTNAQADRSEEHTSELQSHSDLVCRLLLEKKKNDATQTTAAAG